MPQVRTVEDAANVAETFLKKYYRFYRLEKAVKEDGAWLTEYDVGILNKDIVRIRLDAATGKVVEYTKTQTA